MHAKIKKNPVHVQYLFVVQAKRNICYSMEKRQRTKKKPLTQHALAKQKFKNASKSTDIQNKTEKKGK